MTFVKRITSTIQGGLDIELGPKTLIVGKNSSGKSSVRRAIELALTASATDVAGRGSVSKGVDLLQLVGPRQDLVAEAGLSDGTTARLKIVNKVTGKKKSASVEQFVTPPTVGPDVLPLAGLKEAVLGKPETVRKFFLSKAGIKLSRKDVLDRLVTPDKQAAYEALVGQTAGERPAGCDEIDRLLFVLARATETAAAQKKEASTKETVATELGQGLPPPPTEAQTQYAEADLANKVAVLEKVLRQAAIGQTSEAGVLGIEAEIPGLDGRIQVYEQQRDQWEKHLAMLEDMLAKMPAGAQIDPAIVQVTDVLGAMVARGSTFCACCGSTSTLQALTERHAAAKAFIDGEKAKGAQASSDVARVQAEMTKARETIAGLSREVSSATQLKQARVSQALAARARMAQVSTESLPTEADARAAVAAAQKVVTDFAQAKTAWEQAKRVKVSASKGEEASDGMKDLAKACNEVVAQVLQAGIGAFEARVQAFLPPGDKFGLQLNDAGREVCRFGLWHGTGDSLRLDTCLAGSEWAKVMAALGAALSTDSTKLAVLIPEERAWDPDHLAGVMAALASAPQQIILESPISPTFVPVGWTVVSR